MGFNSGFKGLRLSYARISFVGHCDRFFEKKEKALYAWLSFGNGGIQSGVSGHVEEGKAETPLFFTKRDSLLPCTLCHSNTLTTFSHNTDIIPVNSSTNIFTFINLHIEVCFV